MGFEFDRNRMYLMPVMFGPAVTPRQRPDGKRWIQDRPIRKENYTIVYESHPGQLENILPPGFRLFSPHVVMELSMLRDIPWLAGKGYNLCKIQIPVLYDWIGETLTGSLVAVVWENHADPIMTGREQLGWSKIYADIRDVSWDGSRARSSLSSWGFEFLQIEMDFSSEPQQKDEMLAAINPPGNAGLFHYKFMPRTGEGFVKADFAGVTLSPGGWSPPQDAADLPEAAKAEIATVWGRGKIRWKRPRWEDMPTQFHIVDTLGKLEIRKELGALKSVSYSANDWYEQKILKDETQDLFAEK